MKNIWQTLFQWSIAIIASLCTFFVNDMRTDVKEVANALNHQNVVVQDLLIGLRENETKIYYNEKRIARLENSRDRSE
jgi:hypothetical protein